MAALMGAVIGSTVRLIRMMVRGAMIATGMRMDMAGRRGRRVVPHTAQRVQRRREPLQRDQQQQCDEYEFSEPAGHGTAV